MQLISIELVRHLSQVMFNNKSKEIEPFLQNVPLGWYRTKFFTTSKNEYDENDEETTRLVMVFDDQKEKYHQFIEYLDKIDLSDYEETTIDDKFEELNIWSQEYFNTSKPITDDLKNNLFYIASHMGQQSEKPKFFPFDERKHHDMDEIARQYMNFQLFEIDPKLKTEFHRDDRYWNVIYPNFESFRQQFFACVQRLQDLKTGIVDVFGKGNSIDDGLDFTLRSEIKKKYPICLSCGESNKKLLEVDHVNPRYFGGEDTLENLQILCRYCNITKNVLEIDFRTHVTPLINPQGEIKLFDPPRSHEKDDETWIKYIKRLINFFYYSSAVKNVSFTEKEWDVELYNQNNPEWLQTHLKELLEKITIIRTEIDLESPKKLTVHNGEIIGWIIWKCLK